MLDNFFAKLPTDLSVEVFEKLAGNNTVTIERIVSNGQSTQAT
nr:cupin [Shewanella sp. ISTPL2]